MGHGHTSAHTITLPHGLGEALGWGFGTAHKMGGQIIDALTVHASVGCFVISAHNKQQGWCMFLTYLVKKVHPGAVCIQLGLPPPPQLLPSHRGWMDEWMDALVYMVPTPVSNEHHGPTNIPCSDRNFCHYRGGGGGVRFGGRDGFP